MAKPRKKKKAEVPDAETILLMQPPKAKTIKTETLKMSKASVKVALERELRRYVKRTGKFRKDLSDSGKARAKDILKKLDRKEVSWDPSIFVPGYDAPTVKGMFIAD